MKKINMLIIAFILYFSGILIADAGSFSLIPSSNSVTIGSSYTVKVRYSGETLGSAKFNVQFNDVDCTGSSGYSTVISRCTGSACEVTLGYNANGYTSGSTLYTLSCKSNNAGTSRFSVALYNGDAWDVEGLNEISVSSASTSVSVSAATTTTTTKVTTTTTTSRQVITTKPSSKTTTKKTTIQSTTKPVATTVPKNDEQKTTEVNNQEVTTTTTTTTTQESALVVPDDLKLNKLKIVGYKFDFKPNQTNYKIKVAKDVDELYVIAEPIDPNTKVTNLGIINIKDKDYFIIKVYNELTFHSIEYKIVIDRKVDVVNSINNTVVLLAIFVIIAISAVLLSIFKKSKAKLEKVDNVVIDPIKSSVLNSNKFIDDDFIDKDENYQTTELTTIKNIKNKDE